jgi:gamma-glutamylcyclotransferase (GGCT)/AIG2-like uncharacterized protein YtfP
MKNDIIRLFVFGNLKKGKQNHNFMEDSNYIGKGSVSGFDMYDLGSFPALIRGEGVVSGEVYEVDTKLLKKLDQLEGNNSLNKRTKTLILMDDKKELECEMYILLDRCMARDDKKIDGKLIKW